MTTLSPSQQRKALVLLEREERKEVARERLYAELAEKRASWMSSK